MKTSLGDTTLLVRGRTLSSSFHPEIKAYTKTLLQKQSSIAMVNAIPLPAQSEESAFGTQYQQMSYMAYGAACPTESEMLS